MLTLIGEVANENGTFVTTQDHVDRRGVRRELDAADSGRVRYAALILVHQRLNGLIASAAQQARCEDGVELAVLNSNILVTTQRDSVQVRIMNDLSYIVGVPWPEVDPVGHTLML